MCGAMMLAAASEALAGGQAIQANASFSAQIIAVADNDTEITRQETNLKRAMYERAARECTDIMASIAISCSITGINVSAQFKCYHAGHAEIPELLNPSASVLTKSRAIAPSASSLGLKMVMSIPAMRPEATAACRTVVSSSQLKPSGMR